MADGTVECYAGRHYPDRPTAFQWEGERLEVVEVERNWRTQGIEYSNPVLYHYRVRTTAGYFHLIYDSDRDAWRIDKDLGLSADN